MNKYGQPLNVTQFKSIYVKNISAHSECYYTISNEPSNGYDFSITKLGKNLMHELYVEKYLSIFNCKLNDSIYLNNLCKVFGDSCIISFEVDSQIPKSVTLILQRDKPENNRLQLKYGDEPILLKLDKPNSELIQLINGLIYI